MKTTFPLSSAMAFALLAASASAQAPLAGKSPDVLRPQVEIEAKFFTISAESAARLRLTESDGSFGPERKGTLNGAELQKLFLDLNAESSVSQLAAPRVTTKSGQRAVIEIIREFRYPSEFEASADVVTPTTFETRNVGVAIEIEPVVTEGALIEITTTPSVTTFHKFINYAGGKTQAAGKIPKDGFAQPIFDNVKTSLSATLRPEQSLLLGGFAWHGSQEMGLDEQKFLNPGVGPEEIKPNDRKLLFVTLTTKFVNPAGGSARGDERIKAGSPVQVGVELGAASRGRLPGWMAPPASGALGEEWRNMGAVAPGQTAELRKALASAPEKAISAQALASLAPNLAGVVEPEKMAGIRKAIEVASGGPLSVGPTKTISPKERYFAEASGTLRYVATPGEKGGEPANGGEHEGERVDLQLAVEAQCSTGGVIDLNITANVETGSLPGAHSASGGQRVGASADWKLLDQEPHWRTRAVTTSVTVWNGSSVLLARGSPGDKDHVQILLITTMAKPESGTPAAAKPAAAASGLPMANPVPGKEGYVTSPYAPDTGYVDVRGFPSGAEVKCPYSGKKFVVP